MTDEPAVVPGEEELPSRRSRRAAPPSPLALAGLVASLLGLHVVGIVLGHLALRQAEGSGTRRFAIAALVLGYVGLALVLAGWVLYFAVLAPVVTLPG